MVISWNAQTFFDDGPAWTFGTCTSTCTVNGVWDVGSIYTY